jgi:ABC-type branched-subunit amino acid transport system substrate-binding protein
MRTTAATTFGLAALILNLGGAPGCGAPPLSQQQEPIQLGLLLSFSGYLAASSINSERALTMAIEAANTAGGIEGRPLKVMAKDTRSRGGATVAEPAKELFESGVALLIGPDTIDLVTQLRPLLSAEERTILLPSYGTASDVGFGYKPIHWFVMGPGAPRVACELVAQLRADGRSSALVVANAKGYNSAISWNLGNLYGMPKFILPTDQSATASTVNSIVSMKPEAVVLAAFPADASALIYAMAAAGNLEDPTRWYLSPTLHSPAFLATIPKGVLTGAHGISPGTVAGAADFRTSFAVRWHDKPLDDAYTFYDAGAVAALAIERAVIREGAVPTGTGISEHVRAVTHAGGRPIRWDEIPRGLALIRDGQEIEYIGLSGTLEFDSSGQTPTAATKWWVIGEDGFQDVGDNGECK